MAVIRQSPLVGVLRWNSLRENFPYEWFLCDDKSGKISEVQNENFLDSETVSSNFNHGFDGTYP